MDDKAHTDQLDSDLRDRPGLQCGKVEVTPEMVQAGAELVLDVGRDSLSCESAQRQAAEIFRAMLLASQRSRPEGRTVRPEAD